MENARPIKIFTDSCADLPKDVRRKYDISYFRLNFMKEGFEREANLDWKGYSAKELYDGLRDGDHLFTLPVKEADFYKKMSEYARKGYDIVYIACPEVLSKTIVKGRRVAERVMQERKGCRIEIIDSLNASMGQGLVAKQAARYVKQGYDIDTVVEMTKNDRKRVNQYAYVGTLTYLSRANRINASTAILGNLINIKPVLTADINGRQSALCQVRGKEPCMNKVADLIADGLEDVEHQDIYIMHADCIDDALEMKELLIKRGLKPRSFRIGDFGPVVGIATGPGTVCVFGFGKRITFEPKD